MWLQEDSLIIRFEHFSLLTFCHALVLKDSSLTVCWLIKCASCATSITRIL